MATARLKIEIEYEDCIPSDREIKEILNVIKEMDGIPVRVYLSIEEPITVDMLEHV